MKGGEGSLGISTLRGQRLKRLAKTLSRTAAVRSAFLPRLVPTVQGRGHGLARSVVVEIRVVLLPIVAEEKVDPGAGLQRIVGRRPSLGHQAD